MNPCLSCGACCAYYRATFHWSEADDATPGGVPVDMAMDLDQHCRFMKGTGRIPPRCVALEGVIGVSVRCTIYEQRPQVCRGFVPSFSSGKANPHCDKARLAHGLAPLKPDDHTGRPGKRPAA